MERLTPTDAAILAIEDDVSAAHGLTIGVFDGPEPDHDAVVARVEDRIRVVPRYRQRLIPVPFDIERPVWADDPNFQIDFHVRHTALPKRTGRNAFSAFVSRMLSQRLDRGKPLWELWIASGLPDGQWALVSKAHYAIVDGVSGTDLLGLLADSVEVDDTIGRRMPAPLPDARRLLTDAVVDLAFDPMESLRKVGGAVNRPIRAVRQIADVFTDGPDPDSLARAQGPHRRWQAASLELDEIRAVRAEHDCSTTDVILAAVASGIRSYLMANGKPVPRSVTALVPLSVSAASGGLSGQVTTLAGELPIADADPGARLDAIRDQTSRGAAASGAIAGHVLRRQDDFVAPTILGQGVRSTMLDIRDRRSIDTVAINVPGPLHTIEILGHRMVEAYPAIPLPGRVQIAMAAMSLGDTVYFGITSDWDTTEGLRHAAAGVNSAVPDLLAS